MKIKVAHLTIGRNNHVQHFALAKLAHDGRSFEEVLMLVRRRPQR